MKKEKAVQESQTCDYSKDVKVKLAVLLPAAASSSSPEDVGVAAGVVFACSSVLHLLTLSNVILAFST